MCLDLTVCVWGGGGGGECYGCSTCLSLFLYDCNDSEDLAPVTKKVTGCLVIEYEDLIYRAVR